MAKYKKIETIDRSDGSYRIEYYTADKRVLLFHEEVYADGEWALIIHENHAGLPRERYDSVTDGELAYSTFSFLMKR